MYTLDDQTRELLEQVLNMAQTTVDCQYDDAIADSMQLILQETAELFGIAVSELMSDGQVVPISGPDGPKLTLVPGGKDHDPEVH